MNPYHQAHRDFLNRYYGVTRSFYDLTRRYYLFGRDTALRRLLAQPWGSLIEVGPGTGRNLEILHRHRGSARIGGVEAADAMLTHAARRCPWASLIHGFAEDTEYLDVLGEAPQRILFAYSLSMIQDPAAALTRAVAALAPGGEVHIVDFADFAGLPAPLRAGLRVWLARFHVHPLRPAWLAERGAQLSFGPLRYYMHARLRRA